MSPIQRYGKLPAFVRLGETWESLDDFFVYDWEVLAAAAWMGFVAMGKGVVILDGVTFMLTYVPADASGVIGARGSVPLLAEVRDEFLRDLQGHCQRYQQEREIVVLLEGASSANAAQQGRMAVFAAAIPTPRGWLTPPGAYKAFQREARGETGFQSLQQRWENQRRRFLEGGVKSHPATILGNVNSA